MLSSLLRPKNRPSRAERHPLLFGRGGSSRARDHARPAADSDSSQDDEEDDDASDAAGEDEDSRPLLPIFSAAHLGELIPPQMCDHVSGQADRFQPQIRYPSITCSTVFESSSCKSARALSPGTSSALPRSPNSLSSPYSSRSAPHTPPVPHSVPCWPIAYNFKRKAR